jgi:hypothetical protein
MKKLIYLSPYDIGVINGMSNFSNSNAMLKYLKPIDYHSLLFSTLYQTGINYFEISINTLPPIITQNKFWRDRIVEYNSKAVEESINKAIKVLDGNFYQDIDKKYNVSQYQRMIDYLSKLFYALETGTPYINPAFIASKDFDLLEKRMDKGLLASIRNLNTLVVNEKVQTVVPTYSVLKTDVTRFEEICDTTLFKKYSTALQEFPNSDKMELLKKDINSKALKLFNRYGNDFNFKETAFSFVKFNKKILDLFVGKIPSIIGDFVITSTETLTKEKKKIYFHEVNDAKFATLLCNRIDELLKKEGNEGFKKFVADITNKNN